MADVSLMSLTQPSPQRGEGVQTLSPLGEG